MRQKINYIVRPYHMPNFKIVADCDNIVNALCLQYGGYIKNKEVDDYIELRISSVGNGQYSMQYDGEILNTENPLQIIDNLITETTQFSEEIFALHGASVEYKSMAYVFLAATTSGKTTLTAYLSSNGFGYITDDCVLLSRKGFLIHPYNCPIHMRQGGVDVLKSHKIEPDMVLLNDISIKRYIYTPVNCIKTPLPLRMIYFINRNEDENRVLDMNLAESVSELLKSPIISYDVSGEYLRFLTCIAKRGCKRLLYKDLEFVSEVLKREGQNGQAFN